jgi:unsaturated rhamnogalacturonyl hydrolase
VTVVDLVAQRCLGRQVDELNTGWEDTLVPLGLALAGGTGGNGAMVDWAGRWADHHLGVDPHETVEDGYRAQQSQERRRGLHLTQYCGDWGAAMVFAVLHELAPDDRLVKGVRRLADHICDGSLRLPDGTIVHGPWAPVPWVDTLYYTAAPLARAYAVTKDERYAAEAVRQCLRHAGHLRDPQTGCFFHESNPDTGAHTGWLWSRGNGWVIMSLADVLRHCPPDISGWREVLDLYRSLVVGLLRLQHPSGLWRIVPENEESHLETSGSMMISTGVVAGVAEGWLDASHAQRALRTWHEVGTWVDATGAVQGCQSPAGLGGWEIHKRSEMGERTYGTGSFLRFAAELRSAGLIGDDA